MKRTFVSQGLLAILAAACLSLAGCGGSSSTTTTTSTTAPASVVVNPASATVGVAQQFTFSATLKDSSGNSISNTSYPITWSSDNTSVAAVDGSGVATAISAGTAKITATASISATQTIASTPATLTVNPVVSSITISPPSATTTVGGTVQFSAVPKDKNGNPITGIQIAWFSSFANVATINNAGLATGVSKGTVTIVASAGGVQSSPAPLTVQ